MRTWCISVVIDLMKGARRFSNTQLIKECFLGTNSFTNWKNKKNNLKCVFRASN